MREFARLVLTVVAAAIYAPGVAGAAAEFACTGAAGLNHCHFFSTIQLPFLLTAHQIICSGLTWLKHAVYALQTFYRVPVLDAWRLPHPCSAYAGLSLTGALSVFLLVYI